MNLFEAKTLLKSAGYKLLKEHYGKYFCSLVIEKNLEENLKDIDRDFCGGQYILGLSDNEIAQINKLDMHFTYMFSCMGAWGIDNYLTLSDVDDDVEESIGEINGKIKYTVDEMIEGFEDSYGNMEGYDKETIEFYKNMTKEQYTKNLTKILEILLNRDITKDYIEWSI